MPPPAADRPGLPPAATLSALLDDDTDAVLWVDAAGCIAHANRAAARLLGCHPGQPAAPALAMLGAPATAWFSGALKGAKGRFERLLTLAGGRRWRAAVWSVEGGRAVRLERLSGGAPPPIAPAAPTVPPQALSPALHELLALVWAAPMAAALQDADFRLLDANDAFVALTGHRRQALVGRDLVELLPPEDREGHALARQEQRAATATGLPTATLQRRLIDAEGHPRWVAMVDHNLAPPGAAPLWLTWLHDSTAEHLARDEVQRVQDELAQWFDLAGSGMVSCDDSGLIVRSNRAFDTLVGQVPVSMADASADLQALLGWHDGAPAAALVPGAPPLQTQALFSLPEGRRRLGARLQALATDTGARRFMAVVEDLSAEEERDVARLEIGMLMDTASVGVATYDPARGWLLPPPGCRASAATWSSPIHCPSTNGCSAHCAAASAPRCTTRCATPSWAGAGCSRASSPARCRAGGRRPRWSRSTSPTRSAPSGATSNCCAN